MKHAVKHIHFVGIGGAGMSGIAEVLHNLGYTDLRLGPERQRRRLRRLRAARHRASSSATTPRTSPAPTRWSRRRAVQADNPEVHRRARQRAIPVVPRAVMLAELMRLKQGIAIAGTHGKTTTTSLVTSVLAEAGARPDLRHRRPAQQRRRQRRASAAATTSWSRPTSPTRRSST